MTIGELARLCGVHLETVRYYERIGLMPHPERTDAGHRRYADEHVARLQFIRRARELGFGIAETEALLRLSQQEGSCCSAVSDLATAHLQTVREKLADLRRLEAQLVAKLALCRPQDEPDDCPVLELLTDGR